MANKLQAIIVAYVEKWILSSFQLMVSYTQLEPLLSYAKFGYIHRSSIRKLELKF